jgi:hypothetical protein
LTVTRCLELSSLLFLFVDILNHLKQEISRIEERIKSEKDSLKAVKTQIEIILAPIAFPEVHQLNPQPAFTTPQDTVRPAT